MVDVTVHADCGNSPKKEFLKEFNIAFAEGNVAFVAGSVSDDIAWHIVGGKEFQGKPAFVRALEEMKQNGPVALILDTIITHGNEGAVSGTMVLQDGTRVAFCDVVRFASAKGTHIRAMTSYAIEI